MPPPGRTKWQMTLDSLHGLMTFFGRISFLMDENAHAVHFFITALLQLLDRASFLWGEVARFVLRLLGYKRPLSRAASQSDAKAAVDGSGTAGHGAHAMPPSGNDMERVWSSK
jgi:peroxin-13